MLEKAAVVKGAEKAGEFKGGGAYQRPQQGGHQQHAQEAFDGAWKKKELSHFASRAVAARDDYGLKNQSGKT